MTFCRIADDIPATSSKRNTLSVEVTGSDILFFLRSLQMSASLLPPPPVTRTGLTQQERFLNNGGKKKTENLFLKDAKKISGTTDLTSWGMK